MIRAALTLLVALSLLLIDERNVAWLTPALTEPVHFVQQPAAIEIVRITP